MFIDRLEELKAVIEQTSYTESAQEITGDRALALVQYFLTKVKARNAIVYVIGNGGSASIASHFCVDLIKTLGIPAATLIDSALMSCISNDLGYDQVYSFPLEKKMREDDLLIAISSSGKSPNILKAVNVAKEKGANVVTLSGFLSENPLRTLGELNIWLDSCDYGLVEIGHSFLLHTIIDSLYLPEFVKKSNASVYASKSH